MAGESVGHDRQKKYSGIKQRIPQIRSLEMLKMEKNLIAVMEKGYSREPYNKKAGGT